MNIHEAYDTIQHGLLFLPDSFNTPPVTPMLLTIGLQESRFQYRRQIRGPARGFWQFEKNGGVRGVLTNPATSALARNALERLLYPVNTETVYDVISDNDAVAVVFARLLLYTVPKALPGPSQADEAWGQYQWAWRPGKPHRHTWDAFYTEAWDYVGQN